MIFVSLPADWEHQWSHFNTKQNRCFGFYAECNPGLVNQLSFFSNICFLINMFPPYKMWDSTAKSKSLRSEGQGHLPASFVYMSADCADAIPTQRVEKWESKQSVSQWLVYGSQRPSTLLHSQFETKHIMKQGSGEFACAPGHTHTHTHTPQQIVCTVWNKLLSSYWRRVSWVSLC